MALFFSGAVTSSPIKRRSRSSHTCHSLDVSLLSPDSSYVCYSSLDGGDSSCCRRSPRLLTNGYYEVTEDSFSWDEQGNVSLTPCKTSVSYKENLVRVFRRRRRPRNSLVRLISDVTESCQSWLDEKVFRGVFRTGQNQDQEQDQDQDQDQDRDQNQEQDQDQSQNQSQDHDLDLDLDLDLDRTIRSHAGPVLLDQSSWSGLKSTELEENCCFTYDPTEAPPPPDKLAPPPPDKLAPPPIMREEICSEICESKERFTQSLGGLSEVLPPSPFYSNTCCCQASPEDPGFSMKTLLLLGFTVFIFTALVSGSLWWSSSVTSTMFLMVTAFMVVTKSGPMGEWRKAKTEDITSRNE